MFKKTVFLLNGSPIMLVCVRVRGKGKLDLMLRTVRRSVGVSIGVRKMPSIGQRSGDAQDERKGNTKLPSSYRAELWKRREYERTNQTESYKTSVNMLEKSAFEDPAIICGVGIELFNTILKDAHVSFSLTFFILSCGNRPQGSNKGYNLVFIWFPIFIFYMTVAAAKNHGATFSDLFTNAIFLDIVVSATIGLSAVLTIIHVYPPMFGCMYFANVQDVSWGMKGDNECVAGLGNTLERTPADPRYPLSAEILHSLFFIITNGSAKTSRANSTALEGHLIFILYFVALLKDGQRIVNCGGHTGHT
ncbi:hypothetical protein BJY52DRAFT_1227098 [Lactarius psammicola]|nr:hypothetical protein BJY52DRAFT_1227098 [Lactarius psammicola]